jgi:hypothetical protein
MNLSVDQNRLRAIAGDWLGALVAVVAGFASMALVASASLLLIGDRLLNSVSLSARYVPLLLTLAVGGTVTASDTGSDVGMHVFTSGRPLSLTIVGYTIMLLVVMRRLRTSVPVNAANLSLQALAVTVLHTIALVVLALVTKTHLRLPAKVGASTLVLQVDVASTLHYGTLTLAIAFAVAFALARPGLMQGRIEYARSLLAMPIRALRVVTIVLVSLAAIVVIARTAAIAVIPSSPAGSAPNGLTTWQTGIGVGLLFLPNIAYAALLVGIGVPVTGVSALAR